MIRGRFIVIEGGDGAGKDTQIELLKNDFPESAGFVYTRDPGGTELGNELRRILQYGKNVAKPAELLLFLASRAQLVHEVIEPALASGKRVICNRFELSTFAYQVYGRERLALLPELSTMSAFARGNTIPDLTILLDIDPTEGARRFAARGEELTRFEQEKLDFHERVRQGYLTAAKTYPNVVVLDAARPVEVVYVDVKAAVEKTLK